MQNKEIINVYYVKNKGGDILANTVGGWAFLIGVILAVVLAFFTQFESLAWLLVLLGLVVGFLNITEKETQKFLMNGVVLVIVGAFGGDAMGAIPYLSGIFNNLVALFAPAVIIVSLKHVFEMAKTR